MLKKAMRFITIGWLFILVISITFSAIYQTELFGLIVVLSMAVGIIIGLAMTVLDKRND